MPKNKRIVLVGSSQDEHIAAIARFLRSHDHEPYVLDPLRFPGDLKVSLGAPSGDILIGDQALDAPAAVYVRNIYRDPFAFGANAEQAMSDDWRRTMLVFRERSALLSAVLQRWEHVGVRLYNPPSASGNINKPYQLALLHDAGLPVPATLWTNDPTQVRSLRETHELIYKPVLGGARTRRVEEEDLSDRRLAAPATSPVCFQELLPGEDIRVYVIDGAVACALRIVTDAIDFRQNEQKVEAIDLPWDVATQCVRAAQVLGLRWTGMDLKADHDGRYRILELNPSPMFLGFDRLAGTDICGAFGRAVLSTL